MLLKKKEQELYARVKIIEDVLCSFYEEVRVDWAQSSRGVSIEYSVSKDSTIQKKLIISEKCLLKLEGQEIESYFKSDKLIELLQIDSIETITICDD